MKSLLIVAHTPSKNTQTLADALFRGTTDSAIEKVKTTLLSPFDVQAKHVKEANTIILFTTENFGYMSGALKDFFDRIYYPCLEQTQSLPFGLVIRAGLDGTGANTAVHKITGALKWREVQETLICKGDFDESFIEQSETFGLTIAAGLDNDIF